MPWDTFVAILSPVAAFSAIVWGIRDHLRQARRDDAENLQTAAAWKAAVERNIAELKKEIDIRREFDTERHHRHDERLQKAEQQLDEVLALLIQVFQEDARQPAERRPGRRL